MPLRNQIFSLYSWITLFSIKLVVAFIKLWLLQHAHFLGDAVTCIRFTLDPVRDSQNEIQSPLLWISSYSVYTEGWDACE